MNFLPFAALFALFFNLFWSTPVRILSKEYSLVYYYFISPPLMISAVFTIVLAGASFFAPKKWTVYIHGLIAYALITTALYHSVIPYDYLGFVSNETLQTWLNLLGFSRWYYLLDFVVLFGSAIACFLLSKKNLLTGVFGFFLIYYVSQSFFQFQASRFTDRPVDNFTTVALSQNHTNVLYIIYDTTPSVLVEHMIKNVWSENQKKWTKDFTLYDNALGIGGFVSTMGGLPTIFGGYNFSSQKQLERAESGLISENIYYSAEYRAKLNKIIYPDDHNYFFSTEAIEYLSRQLPNTEVSYDFLGDNQMYPETKIPKNYEVSAQARLPFAAVALYSRTPYFLRGIFPKQTVPTRWKDIWHTKAGWMQAKPKDIKLTVEETGRSALAFVHFIGVHDVPVVPGDIESQKREYESTVTTMMSNLNDIVGYLKEKGVYDRTKIIITSDHGLGGGNLFIRSISTPQLEKFYAAGSEQALLGAAPIPSLMMIKDFGAERKEMSIDSRLISLADMHGVLLNSFGKTTVPDYTKRLPPKRIFNVPSFYWQYIAFKISTSPSKYYKNTNWAPKKKYLEIHSVKDGEFFIRELDSTNELIKQPPYEVVQ